MIKKLLDLNAFLWQNEEKLLKLHEIVEDHWGQEERRAASRELIQTWTDQYQGMYAFIKELREETIKANRQSQELLASIKKTRTMLEKTMTLLDKREASLDRRKAILEALAAALEDVDPEPNP